MTLQQHATYLKMAFQCVGLGFNDEQVEIIMLTTQAVKNKKCRFSVIDAAKILATINEKYPKFTDSELFDDIENIDQTI